MTLFNHSSLVRHEPTEEQIEKATTKKRTPRGTPIHKQPVPRVTVAGVVVGDTLRLGISRCSVKDNFSKAKGRYVSEQRARERPSKIVQIPEKETNTLGRFFFEQAQELIKLSQGDVIIPRFFSGEINRRPVDNDRMIEPIVLKINASAI